MKRDRLNIFLLTLFTLIIISCNNEKIGVEVIDKDVNINTKEKNVEDIKIEDIKEDSNTGVNVNNNINNANKLSLNKEEEPHEKITKYIKNNFIKINPTGNNYDKLVNISFEGVSNVNVEFIENNQTYKLILEYKIDNFNFITELTRLGYYTYEDKKWKRLTSIPEEKENINNVSNKDKEEIKKNTDNENLQQTSYETKDKAESIAVKESATGSTISEKEKIQNMILEGDKKLESDIKGFDNLSLSKLSLNVSYPKYWYWRWVADQNSIATIIFSKAQVENIEDAEIVLRIKKNNVDVSPTTSLQTVLTKQRDEKTIFEIVGPSNMQSVLQKMIDSAIKIDINTLSNTGSAN